MFLKLTECNIKMRRKKSDYNYECMDDRDCYIHSESILCVVPVRFADIVASEIHFLFGQKIVVRESIDSIASLMETDIRSLSPENLKRSMTGKKGV